MDLAFDYQTEEFGDQKSAAAQVLEIDIDGSNFAAPHMKMDDSKRPAKCDGKMKSLGTKLG